MVPPPNLLAHKRVAACRTPLAGQQPIRPLLDGTRCIVTSVLGEMRVADQPVDPSVDDSYLQLIFSPQMPSHFEPVWCIPEHTELGPVEDHLGEIRNPSEIEIDAHARRRLPL